MHIRNPASSRLTASVLAASLLVAIAVIFAGAHQRPEPLASWNNAPHKQAILDFVLKATTEGSPDFVPVEQRIAVLDNDGALLCEQPLYVQFLFAEDRVKALAPQHPEWKDKPPFKFVLDGDGEGRLEDNFSAAPSKSMIRRALQQCCFIGTL